MSKEFNYDELLQLTNKEFADHVKERIDMQKEIREVITYRVRIDRHGVTEEEAKADPDNAPIVVVDYLSGWQGVPDALWTHWFDTHTKQFDWSVVNIEALDRFHALAAGADELPELGFYSFRSEPVPAEPFLIGISYSDYVPGMKLYLHQDHESLHKGDVVEIKEIGGYDSKTNTFKHSGELFFITSNGVKIIWNEVPISCYIERDATTSFLESMFDHYRVQADRNLKDVANYEWSQRNYNDFLEDKHSTLVEMLIAYERQRVYHE